MSTSAVSSAGNNQNTSQLNTTKAASSMGKDEFLKLLITQLQNQDPMKPMDDSQFVAQLAQFSSLEQMSNIAASSDSSYKSQATASAISMIGKNIEWSNADTGLNKTGKVESISFIDGMPKLNVGASSVEVSNVVKVY